MLAYVLLAAFTLLVIIYFYKISNRPPGPWGLPIIGYLPWIDPKRPYLTFTNLSKQYGPIYGLNMGSVYTVVLSDPKLIREAFAKQAFTGRAPLYVTHGIMKGWGLICAEGELWKDQRKFTAQTLRHLGMIKGGPRRDVLEQQINEGVEELLRLLERQAENNERGAFDPLPYLQHSIGNIMNRIVFGVKFDLNDPQWRWLLEIQEEGCKLMGVTGPLNFIPILRFIPSLRKPLEYIIAGQKKTHVIYHKIINEYKQQRSQPNFKPLTEHFIAAFINERQIRIGDSTQKYYNDSQFVHLLADIFGAGLDTTLSTLRWFVLYVTLHKDVQSKLYTELQSLNRAPNVNDHLPYLEATIAETQRIRSVVPVGIPHGCIEATTFNGFSIPKGTMVVPLQWAVHMNVEYWEEPEVFKPERFLDENGLFVKRDGFIPFQTGKRICVGEELARMLLVSFGASILYKFELDPEGELDTEGECGITFSPTRFKVQFKPRN